jgi:hypothetical protein
MVRTNQLLASVLRDGLFKLSRIESGLFYDFFTFFSQFSLSFFR